MFNEQASTTVQFQYCEHNYSILPTVGVKRMSPV